MKKIKTSAAIMQQSLLRLILGITLLLFAAIIVVVGASLYSQAMSTTYNMAESLKKTDIDGDDDWENWRKNSTLDTSKTYVFVHNMRKDAKQTTYYSPNAEMVLKTAPTKVPFLTHLYWRPGVGLLFHRMVHTRGIYYTLWQNMNPEFGVLLRVAKVTLVLLILVLLTAPLYIRRLTRRLTNPLTTLSTTTKAISQAKEPGTLQLPVPTQPKEVVDLAQNFNELLAMLNERQEQQKLFVMNAAHQLRTPIATIKSHAQLIERHADAHPEIVAKSVRYITEESRQMQRLIEALLQLSRADRLSLELTDVNISDALQAMVDKLTGPLDHPVVTTIPEGLHARASLEALEQIMANLLSNAAKYSPQNQAIDVVLSQVAGGVAIAVKDRGRGIDEADLPHVFERFYRAADVRGTIPGTGLGLAIAAQLATLSQSQLTVAANPLGGTIFTLTLPLN